MRARGSVSLGDGEHVLLRITASWRWLRDAHEQHPLADVEHVARLSRQLDAALAQAKKGGAQAQRRTLDASSEAELRSLGYMK